MPEMPETPSPKPQRINWRGLTSLVVTLAFLVLAATGVMLYISPQGRVANWTGWSILGLGKEQWAAVHTTAGLLFLIAAGFHVYFNWQVLLRYLVLKKRLHLKREMIGAVVAVAAVFAGTVMDIPPFSNIADLNDGIKAYWEGRSAQAPYPHAEASTLADFSARTGMPMEMLQQRFAAAGITVGDPAAQTLAELAQAHGISPTELFARVADQNKGGGRGQGAGYGAGMGRKSLKDLCEGQDFPLDKALDLLKQHGFTASAESTLKTLAEEKGMTPAQVRDLLFERHD